MEKNIKKDVRFRSYRDDNDVVIVIRTEQIVVGQKNGKNIKKDVRFRS